MSYIFINEAIQTNYKHYIHVHNCAYDTFLCYIEFTNSFHIYYPSTHVKQDEDFVILGNEHSYSHIPDERVLMVLK